MLVSYKAIIVDLFCKKLQALKLIGINIMFFLPKHLLKAPIQGISYPISCLKFGNIFLGSLAFFQNEIPPSPKM